jgi:hypothetical protein
MWWAGLVQAGLGAVQTISSSIAASKLPSQQKYKVAPEMREAMGMYKDMANTGASGAERAAFDQRLARRSNSATRTLQNIGLSSLGPAISNIFSNDANNRFAEMSSGIRRQGIAGYAGQAGQIQGIDNMNVSAFNQELNMKRQALGQGIQTGTKNMVGGITGSMGAKFAQDQGNAYMDYLNSGGQPPLNNSGGQPPLNNSGGQSSLIGDQGWYNSMYGSEYTQPLGGFSQGPYNFS